MAMARAAGMLGVLVLSGETKPANLEGIPDCPDVVVENAGKFGIMLSEAKEQAAF